MRKILILVFVWLLVNPLYAQHAWRFPWTKKVPRTTFQGTTQLSNINISYQLDRRMARTFKQARLVHDQLPRDHRIIMGEPIQYIFKTGELNASELYPDLSFLKNSAQTGKYLVARNNRLFVQEIRRMKQIWAQIDENLPRLQTEATNTQQPDEPISWLAEILPPTTTQFFIGEAHGYPEIYQFVAQLTHQLRTHQPNREIILFTEFLPENFKWTGHRPNITQVPEIFHKYFSIWDQARQANIQVVGLELPNAVDDYCKVRYLNAQGTLDKQSVWSSLEGVRLRNERWQKTLAAYRAQHPNALFVIYTGADHSMYNRPFTLTNEKEQTFVSVLYPDRYTSFVPSGRFGGTFIAKPIRGPLERLVEELDFQRPVIKWQSPDLAHIAGFDVRLKIPVTLPDVDN